MSQLKLIRSKGGKEAVSNMDKIVQYDCEVPHPSWPMLLKKL